MMLCGRIMDESYAEIGTKVVLGRHVTKQLLSSRGTSNNWSNRMDEFVGMVTTITWVWSKDGCGCLLCKVEGNDWYWRVENMILASDIPLLTDEQRARLGIQDG